MPPGPDVGTAVRSMTLGIVVIEEARAADYAGDVASAPDSQEESAAERPFFYRNGPRRLSPRIIQQATKVLTMILSALGIRPFSPHVPSTRQTATPILYSPHNHSDRPQLEPV